MKLFDINWNHLKLFEINWNYLKLFEINWNYLKLFEIYYLKNEEIIWNFLKLFKIIWNYLQDFLPTEVQRLVKYRLLFQELAKNTESSERARLAECADASGRISAHVNRAVTECENRKRVRDINTRLDTRDFDAYCTKSSVLLPYKVS